jgi:hypothetical protein
LFRKATPAPTIAGDAPARNRGIINRASNGYSFPPA